LAGLYYQANGELMADAVYGSGSMAGKEVMSETRGWGNMSVYDVEDQIS
jgi:hypothetical protein